MKYQQYYVPKNAARLVTDFKAISKIAETEPSAWNSPDDPE